MAKRHVLGSDSRNLGFTVKPVAIATAVSGGDTNIPERPIYALGIMCTIHEWSKVIYVVMATTRGQHVTVI